MSAEKPYLIVTAHTPGYADLAALLRADCERLGLPLRVFQFEDRGKWEWNCAAKPEFIYRAMKETPERAIVWVDADARIRSDPTLFAELAADDRAPPVDFAGHWFRWSNSHEVELLSGTMYWGATDWARWLLGDWGWRCERDPDEWDQRHLKMAVCQSAPIMTEKLPGSYCSINDKRAERIQLGEGEGREEAVIWHAQASRERKERR